MSRQEMPFSRLFDLHTGLCAEANQERIERHLSDMKVQFQDVFAAEKIIAANDPLLYEFYDLGNIASEAGRLMFGTTVLQPGKIGSEYYMTKGHFHNILDTAEVYYTLQGTGLLVMETLQGDTNEQAMSPGRAVYVPGEWAHRCVNTGNTPLVVFYVYPADAGHNYGTIEKNGFRNIVVEQNGRPVVIENPRRKEEKGID